MRRFRGPYQGLESIILGRAFFQQRRRKKKQKHLGAHCLQLLRPDQDILHNIFCFTSPWLFKFLCPGGWPVKDWTAHLASTSPSQLQTSNFKRKLSPVCRGPFRLRSVSVRDPFGIRSGSARAPFGKLNRNLPQPKIPQPMG